MLAEKGYGRKNNTETFRKAASQDGIQKAAVGRGMVKTQAEPTPACDSPVLRLGSMKAGPGQPHTTDNSEARVASAGYFGRLDSIPSWPSFRKILYIAWVILRCRRDSEHGSALGEGV